MPTKRTRTLIIAALLLYFFANQTQIGWLYVMSALLAGIVAAAWLLNRGMLKDTGGERTLNLGELHEGEPVSIRLSLTNARRVGAAQVRTTERCPLAEPGSAQHEAEVFIPLLPGRGAVEFAYDVVAYRRGLHTFPPLALETQAPFGFFQRLCTLNIPTRALIFPEVRRLRRLSLLDRQPAAEQARPRAGLGAEVIGVRPFRTGDSPRHIHWRSTARTGNLISKEFADEAHPGLTIVLDLFGHPYPATLTKHAPFEWAIKAAASIAEYAQRRGYALYLAADPLALAPPPGPLAWDALMQYLARVEPTGTRSLGEVMHGQPVQTYTAAILPWPDSQVIEPLLALKHRGIATLAVLIDPASFPEGGDSAALLFDEIRSHDLDARLVRFGEDWAGQISEAASRTEEAAAV